MTNRSIGAEQPVAEERAGVICHICGDMIDIGHHGGDTLAAIRAHNCALVLIPRVTELEAKVEALSAKVETLASVGGR